VGSRPVVGPKAGHFTCSEDRTFYLLPTVYGPDLTRSRVDCYDSSFRCPPHARPAPLVVSQQKGESAAMGNRMRIIRLAGLVLIAILVATPPATGVSSADCVDWGSSCEKCTAEDCDACGGADCIELKCGPVTVQECPPGT
jgi:hypothetical protein